MPANQFIEVEPTLNAVQEQFIQIADEEKLVSWKKESQYALQAIYKNPKLMACTPVSVQNAIINVASVGLTLNPSGGYAYLVPEYNKATNQNECQLRISFKGLAKVAVDSGALDLVRAVVVKEADQFHYRGPCEKPLHDMEPFKDRGNTIGVYCIAKTSKGDWLTDTMPKAEIDKIRSKAKYDAVWAEWYDEMAKKAIIKRASKQWPTRSERLDKTISVINEYEGSDFERIPEAQALPSPIAKPEPLAIEHYPQDKFDNYFNDWSQAILAGKRTTDDLIALIESKYPLTEEQKNKILSVKGEK